MPAGSCCSVKNPLLYQLDLLVLLEDPSASSPAEEGQAYSAVMSMALEIRLLDAGNSAAMMVMTISATADAWDAQTWQEKIMGFLQQQGQGDAAHDLQHIRRVFKNAREICLEEGGDWQVVLPAVLLHDCVHVAKSSPLRTKASVLAAETAVAWLQAHDWPYGKLDAIGHAIAAHSFSANLETKTLEAKIVQDADRLDALGAVGIARTLMLGGELRREFYHANDPFCDHRDADDSLYTLDHFFRKLFTLVNTMKTASGRRQAQQRTDMMHDYLRQLRREIAGTGEAL